MKSNLRIVGYLCTGTDYLRLSQFFFTDQIREGWLEDKSGIWTALCQEDEAADMVLQLQAGAEQLKDMLSRLVKENDLAMPNENYQWMYSPMRVECLKVLEGK